MMLTNTGIFCAVLNYAKKVDLSKYYWNPLKLQFEKERHTWLRILKLFTNIVYELSLKNAWLPPIFFFHSLITLFKRYISCIIVNWGKNTFELVGNALKVALTERKEERKPQFRRPFDVVKDGAHHCYCAYVPRISRSSDFLSAVLINTGIFLCGSKLFG